MKMGWCGGTGNHKGCPYDGFDVAYYQRNDGVEVLRLIAKMMTARVLQTCVRQMDCGAVLTN